MVKISDPLMSKKYGHRTPPGLGFFRKGNYLKFDGKLEFFIIKYLSSNYLFVLPKHSSQNMAHEEIEISFYYRLQYSVHPKNKCFHRAKLILCEVVFLYNTHKHKSL
jgi:hypothetical protein